MTLNSEPNLTDTAEYRHVWSALDPYALPGVSSPSGMSHPLAQAALLRAAADELLTRLVADYVDAGWTQESVGAAFGVSKQAVSRRRGRRARQVDTI